MPGETLTIQDQAKILEAKSMVKEAQDDVKQLRVEFYEMKKDTAARIDKVQMITENIRDNHLEHLKCQMNDFKIETIKGLAEIKTSIEKNVVSTKMNKTLVWFVFVEIFILVAGGLSAIMVKAITSALFNSSN
jgi:predicted RNase H-like nuclease (RuvC/YqgF family)